MKRQKMRSGRHLLTVMMVMMVAQQIGVGVAGAAGNKTPGSDYKGAVGGDAAKDRYGEPFLPLELDWAMTWGKWGEQEFCPTGTFAYAFRIKVESEKAKDDTSLNAIELFCRNPRDVDHSHSLPKKKAKEFRITSAEGKWGKWQGRKECANGLLTGMRMRSEEAQGPGDDTAANDLEMQCNHSSTTLNGGGNRWGHFSNWVTCEKGWAICGLQTRVESDVVGDDTALNDVRMFCCNLGKDMQ